MKTIIGLTIATGIAIGKAILLVASIGNQAWHQNSWFACREACQPEPPCPSPFPICEDS